MSAVERTERWVLAVKRLGDQSGTNLKRAWALARFKFEARGVRLGPAPQQAPTFPGAEGAGQQELSFYIQELTRLLTHMIHGTTSQVII